ncbi:DNA polymerase Y family protein [Streptomyces sp. NPDC054956]
MTEHRILHAFFHIQPGSRADMYEQLLALAENITPRVQAIPPDAAHLDITGALRYFDRDPEGIAALLRMRTMALHGVQTTCAIAPTRMLATMAAAVTPPGATTIVEAAAVQAWLRPRPVAALHGVGPATATRLRAYGLHTIGDLADAPLPALTRIFGAATGRSLHAHAHGHDLRTVQPQPIAKSATAVRDFDHDVLDPVEHRRALLDLAEELGGRLRDEQQIAGNLTLTVRYADRSTSSRSRTHSEPTAHTRPLAGTAYELYDSLGLQRARVRSIGLRAQDLRPAAEAAEQLTLGPSDDRARAIEAVTDRARARYGHGTIRPAALAATGGRRPDTPPTRGTRS